MIGYSTGLVKKNKDADGKLLGVKLGRHCIKEGISVIDIARKLGVSRQTIYNWFIGKGNPTEDQMGKL